MPKDELSGLMLLYVKNIAVVLTAAFYLLLSSGVSVDLHYCLGDLREVKIFSINGAEDCCGTENSCVIDREINCCDFEHFTFQIDTDQLNTGISLSVPNDWQHWQTNGLINQVNDFSAVNASAVNESYSLSSSLPRIQPTYLLNCSFIFYG